MAETEAEAALRMGEVPVGCVFVRGGAVVARCEVLGRSGKISCVIAFRQGTNHWILLYWSKLSLYARCSARAVAGLRMMCSWG